MDYVPHDGSWEYQTSVWHFTIWLLFDASAMISSPLSNVNVCCDFSTESH